MMEEKKINININGKEYDSLENVPEEFRDTVREQFDRARQNPGNGNIKRGEKYTINGVEYNSIEDVPEEHRAMAKEQMARIREGLGKTNREKYIIDGKEYNSFEEVPLALRTLAGQMRGMGETGGKTEFGYKSPFREIQIEQRILTDKEAMDHLNALGQAPKPGVERKYIPIKNMQVSAPISPSLRGNSQSTPFLLIVIVLFLIFITFLYFSASIIRGWFR